MKNKSLFTAIVLLLITMNGFAQVHIGDQIWTETNLDVSTFRNGDAIPQATTDEEWYQAGKAGKPAWCYFGFDSENGPKYGKIYNGFAVTDPRGLAPDGWHVPNDAEWKTLIGYLGGSDVAGKKMKVAGGWDEHCKAGTNESGFAGLPGGICYSDGAYTYRGYNCFWWSATEYDPEDPSCGSLHTSCDDNSVSLGTDIKRDGLYVRCIKDIAGLPKK